MKNTSTHEDQFLKLILKSVNRYVRVLIMSRVRILLVDIDLIKKNLTKSRHSQKFHNYYSSNDLSITKYTYIINDTLMFSFYTHTSKI